MGKVAGDSRATALLGHKASDLAKTERVLANQFGELAVGMNCKRMDIEYTEDDQVQQATITREIGGRDVTERITFTYNLDGYLRRFVKTVL